MPDLMAAREIVIRGASEHNLKGIDLTLPRNKLIVVTGVSGSGKSSLAFDTLVRRGAAALCRVVVGLRASISRADGKARCRIDRRAVAGDLDRAEDDAAQPTVDRRHGHGDLRLPEAALRPGGTPALSSIAASRSRTNRCSRSSMRFLNSPSGTRVQVLAPIVRGRKGVYKKELTDAARQGFVRARVDGEVRDLSDPIDLDKQKKHTIEIVVDRLVIKPDLKNRLTDSVETALATADGLLVVDVVGRKDLLFSRHLACSDCGVSVPELAPRMFSFNSPFGACETCDGIGFKKRFVQSKLIKDEDVAIRDGALAWGDAGRYQLMESSIFKHYKVNPKTPYKKLSARFKKILWDGAGDREFNYVWKGKRSTYKFRSTWDGILYRLEKRYRESASEKAPSATREERMAIQPCQDCDGLRLRP